MFLPQKCDFGNGFAIPVAAHKCLPLHIWQLSQKAIQDFCQFPVIQTMEYHVELLEVTVTKLDVSILSKSSGSFDVKLENHSSVHPPKDSDEPTVMITSQSQIKDELGTQFSMSLISNFIFKFDSIPDDWGESASEYCSPLIQGKIFDIAFSVLRSMGHKFTATAKNP